MTEAVKEEGKFRERQKEEEMCGSLSYCRHNVYQRRQQQISVVFLKSMLILSDRDESHPPTQSAQHTVSGFYASHSDTKDFRCRQWCALL